MELFETLKKSDNIWDAQIVGKNLFCKNPDSCGAFGQYFDFCIKIAGYPVELESRSFFVSEAELALNVFSEKVNISEETLAIIQQKRNELLQVASEINDLVAKGETEDYNRRIKANNDCLSKLSRLKGDLFKATTQTSFEKALEEISVIETSLEKALLTESQITLYNALTKEYSEIVSKKMAELSYSEDVAYNKDAVESFKKSFTLFKSNESKYSEHDNNLYELVSKYLFAYDAKRLFNETLIFYNHVYSYIFNKLDDDGKYRFTQFSLDTPKIK